MKNGLTVGPILFPKRLKFVLAHAAFRANPVVRQVIERSARPDAVIRVADSRVIYISARGAFVFHFLLSDTENFLYFSTQKYIDFSVLGNPRLIFRLVETCDFEIVSVVPAVNICGQQTEVFFNPIVIRQQCEIQIPAAKHIACGRGG